MDSAKRTNWETYVVVLGSEGEIPRQYLRRLLAARVGRADAWDWAAAPDYSAVRSLCGRFAGWLKERSRLPVKRVKGQPPHVPFLPAVCAVNAIAYNAIGDEYLRKWKNLSPEAHQLVNDFSACALARTGASARKKGDRPRLLDAGCGPAIHLRAFHEAGFDCLGIDGSPRMVALAKQRVTETGGAGRRGHGVRVEQRDAFDLADLPADSFQAVWFSAVMVHLPRRFAQRVINNLARILRRGGALHLSAQSGGDAALRKEGRFFVYYTEAELEARFQAAGLRILTRWHDTAHKGACGDRRTKYWINYFLTK